jgi:hypothetical protein
MWCYLYRYYLTKTVGWGGFFDKTADLQRHINGS